VQLDPAAPLERLGFIARDAGLTVVVTEPALAGTAEAADLCAVYLDRGGLLAMPPDGTAAAPGAGAGPPAGTTDRDPAHLAYVMYTSGSTGTPKGVSVTHAQVVPLLQWAVREFRLTRDDRVLHYLSIFFDWSVYEVFLALASG